MGFISVSTGSWLAGAPLALSSSGPLVESHILGRLNGAISTLETDWFLQDPSNLNRFNELLKPLAGLDSKHLHPETDSATIVQSAGMALQMARELHALNLPALELEERKQASAGIDYRSRLLWTTLKTAREALAEEALHAEVKEEIEPHSLSFLTDKLHLSTNTSSVEHIVGTLKRQGFPEPFTDVLIWNTGLAMTRLIGGVHAFSERAIGDQNAIRVITVISDGDKEAAYRSSGDIQIAMKGRTPNETYNNLDQYRHVLRQAKAIVEARGEQGRLAVMVGWGYIAEKPEAELIAQEEGVVFVGPDAENIINHGDKAKAKEMAKAAGVPIIEGQNVETAEEAEAAADGIGYPVMLKARHGGGGRGMRVVRERGRMKAEFEAARRESKQAFGSEELLIEKFLEDNRHIEFQFVADHHGNAEVLAERDCTAQRRHQKVVEFGASETVPLAQRVEIRKVVAELARQSGYRNVGTAEFLYNPANEEFAFLEVNTRLQVEHGVTEAERDVDLVQVQLAVAMGARLDQIFSPLQLWRFRHSDPQHFTLAVRIIAEDGWTGTASTGKIKELTVPHDIKELRQYFSVKTGSRNAGLGDPQIGHLFVTAANRRDAIVIMLRALDLLSIKGIQTNIPFLRQLLQAPQFVENRFDTKFLEEIFIPEHEMTQDRETYPEVAIMAQVINLYDVRMETLRSEFEEAIETGTVTASSSRRQLIDLNYDGNRYEFEVEADDTQTYYISERQGGGKLSAPTRVEWLERPRAERQLKIGDKYYNVAYGDESVSVNGGEAIEFVTLDPTRIESTLDGKIVAILVEPGQSVNKDDCLYVIEAAKNEFNVLADHQGSVEEISVKVGDQAKKGTLIMKFRPEGVEEVEGERIDEWPSSGRERYSLMQAAGLLFQGVSIAEPILKDAVKSAKEDQRISKYVAQVIELINQFWKRERDALKNTESRRSWNYQLSRGTLKEQLGLVLDLLTSLQEINLNKLNDKLKTDVFSLLNELAAFSQAGSDYSGFALKARFLLKRNTPEEAVDVLSELQQLKEISGPDAETEAIGRLERSPQSLARSIIPLLSHEDNEVRQNAAYLLLRRTYSAYPIKEAFVPPIPNALRYTFDDNRGGELRHGIGVLVKPQAAASTAELVQQFADTLQQAYHNLKLPFRASSQKERTTASLQDDVIELTARLPGSFDRNQWVEAFEALLNELIPEDKPRRVTLTLVNDHSDQPYFQTFRPDSTSGEWKMDLVMEDFHPIDAETLEMDRLAAFGLKKVTTRSRHIHLFDAQAEDDKLMTARVAIPYSQIVPSRNGPQLPQAEEAFAEALTSLVQALTAESRDTAEYGHNNVFVSVENVLALGFDEIRRLINRIGEWHRNEFSIAQLRTAEIVLRVRDEADRGGRGFKTIRAVIKNPTGDNVVVRIGVEVADPHSKKTILLPLDQFLLKRADENYVIPRDLILQVKPYEPMTPLKRKRDRQVQRGNTYVYDLPEIIQEQLTEIWLASRQNMPERALVAEELVLQDPSDPSGGVKTVQRAEGENDLSVVAWRMRVLFPGETEPREFIMGANDTTIDNGSMDLPDDRLYTAAARQAIREGLPFVFGFSGSGARMFPNEQVGRRSLYDKNNDSLLLTEEDFEELRQERRLIGTPIQYDGRTMYRLDGVEAYSNQSSLMGSGLMIEASAAVSEEVPTLGLAIGSAAVGKQAYAYRLLNSTIQLKRTAVLLTGKGPINAGIGREAYTSNKQIGGYRVHSSSGVTHNVAETIEATMRQMLEWVRFQSRKKPESGTPASQLPTIIVKSPRQLSSDQIAKLEARFEDWDVEERLLSGESPVIRLDEHGKVIPYDPRDLARTIFDPDSFVEAQQQYAPNVVVGRATIGGIATGGIFFETRTRQVTRPSDPAKPVKGQDRTIHRAGRVWDEAGAFKTAEWIEAMNWEGHPMVMVPNIRGFLGDATALINEVIKHGARIVRQIKQYRQPFVIWMPPYAELRGGAWVVIDPRINPQWIRFYSDPKATLGVLEPEMMLPLPHVRRPLIQDKATLGDEVARKKWLKLFRLSDSPEIAVHQGQLHGVVPTAQARRQIFTAIVDGLK